MPELYHKFRLKITPFTYVLIGSGENLDPTQYVIKNKKLWLLNQSAFIADLAQNKPTVLQEFDTIDFKEISKLFAKYFDPTKTKTWVQAHACSADDEETYHKQLENPDAQMMIAAFIRNSLSGNPYIPGSSIKGAMRTAWLADRISQKKVTLSMRDAKTIDDRDMEPKLLSYLIPNRNGRVMADITADPFKYVKVADCEFPASNLVLKTVKNVKQNPGIHRRHSEAELAFSAQVLQRSNEQFAASISIDKRWIEKQGDIKDFFDAVHSYYLRKLRLDQFFWTHLNRATNYKNLMDYGTQAIANEFIIKIGKGSGSIFTSLNPQQPQTRTIVGGLPMGWCKVSYEEDS